MPYIKEWNGARMDVTKTYGGRATAKYRVELLSGNWPTDDELISLCDGNTPPYRNDFGGKVIKTGTKTAEVEVWID